MDVCELQRVSKKYTALDTPRPPLVPAERNNAAVSTRRPRTREVSSRYKSPTPSTPAAQRRCPSPNLTRGASAASQLVPKRAQSAERKRPSTPQRPTSPSTPVQESSVDVQLSSRRTAGRLPESLWPSTMRSLSVSFQSDIISIPVSKKEKPVSNTASDRTLRPSSNVAHKQIETPTVTRKLTPERRRSPLKGKNTSDQSENSKPVDSLPARLIDQHRWPSRMSGKVSSNVSTKSVDLADKGGKTPVTPRTGLGPSSLRRMSPAERMGGKPLQKSASDAAKLASLDDSTRLGTKAKSVDDNTLWKSDIHKLLSTISFDRNTSTSPAVRSQSLPTTGSRPSSPSKISRPPSPSKTLLPPSISRGISPSRSRPSTPPRGVSPSRIRISNPPSQSSSTSVLSFIADIRKGKKTANYIEDAHQLRLLHNRYLQWRFANAREDDLLYFQKVTGERTLCNVWATILALRDSVSRKRIDLQLLKLELKLSSILNEQMPYLEDWALLERDHISSLSGAVEDLEASTLRLPVTGGARSNIETLKAAISSAVDVMQVMGSSICSSLSRVEGTNRLVSELAVLAAQERVMLNECENLLSNRAALQVEETSLRTHLIQMKEALEKGKQQQFLAIKSPP